MCSRNRSGSRRLLLVLAAASFFVSAPATAQESQTDPKAVPVLSGGYVWTQTDNCIPVSGEIGQTSGSLNFDPSQGTVKVDAWVAEGNPLTLSHAKLKLTYANSQSTLTIGSTTYRVTYGKLEGGIATYLSTITVESDGCGGLGVLSRQ